jgi:hypothetical protein
VLWLSHAIDSAAARLWPARDVATADTNGRKIAGVGKRHTIGKIDIRDPAGLKHHYMDSAIDSQMITIAAARSLAQQISQ